MKYKFFVILILLISGLLGLFLSYKINVKANISASDLNAYETYHYPENFVSQLKKDANAGEKIYKEYCSACHSAKPLVDIKAPRVDDKVEWQNRLKPGFDSLMKKTLNGVGAMPARGGCFECSDEQLKKAILYMINATKNEEIK